MLEYGYIANATVVEATCYYDSPVVETEILNWMGPLNDLDILHGPDPEISFACPVSGQRFIARPGDWIIRDADCLFVRAHDQFIKNYIPLWRSVIREMDLHTYWDTALQQSLPTAQRQVIAFMCYPDAATQEFLHMWLERQGRTTLTEHAVSTIDSEDDDPPDVATILITAQPVDGVHAPMLGLEPGEWIVLWPHSGRLDVYSAAQFVFRFLPAGHYSMSNESAARRRLAIRERPNV